MLKCSLDAMGKVFAAVSEAATLYLPIDREDGTAAFEQWQPGAEWSRALNTVRSPKDFFFPQTENLMEFKTSGKNIEIIDTRSEQEDFVVFGVRACDVKSFDILDRVFLSDPVDSYYAARRDHGVIVSVACTRPSETCFCGTFGIDAASPEGDVTVWRTDSEVYWQPNTEKGVALIDKLGDLLTDCDDAAVEEQKAKIAAVMNRLPLRDLTTEKFGAGKTQQFFGDPAWDSLSEACLGCGTCTFVCPTCQCYDIKDFNTGSGVIRFRCWDSCMYSEFTRMAHGNNRVSQKERFRQRFMHKLVYYPENNGGLFSCVGCGRCLSRCPSSMNIVKVMKRLGGADSE